MGVFGTVGFEIVLDVTWWFDFLGWKSPESVLLFEHIQISKWTERASIPSFSPTPNVGGKRALSNYGNDLKPLADAHQLDWSYLMAHCIGCSEETLWYSF